MSCILKTTESRENHPRYGSKLIGEGYTRKVRYFAVTHLPHNQNSSIYNVV